MRVSIVLLFLFGVTTQCIAEPSVPANRLDPENTYAVIVGVLAWEERALTTYATDIRQDVELHKELLAMGVPKANMSLLLDEAASKAGIEQEVQRIAKLAGENSTLIVYYAGHGMRNRREGIFACYDIKTSFAKETGWRHSQLATSIQSHFGGSNVLLFADCCFSGALEDVAEDLGEHGFRAASLTSASPFNLSTSNWTFTLSLIEALHGEAITDQNADGAIALDEAALDVKQAMNHYEQQASGFSTYGLPKEFQLSKAQTLDRTAVDLKQQDDVALFKYGQYVMGRHNNTQRIGRVLGARSLGKGQDEQEFFLQLQAYNKRPRVWLSAKRIVAAKNPKLSDEPPVPLATEAARQKASLDGKYTDLLAKLDVPTDFRYYTEFRDFGMWSSNSYAGYENLPQGYWVYVYPSWYIWDNTAPMAKVEEELPAYDARQMLGEPNTPTAGDFGTAWAAPTENDQKAWVELKYVRKQLVTEVHIVETFNPGAVYQVTGFVDDKEVVLWKGADPAPKAEAMCISKIPIDSGHELSKIRLYLNCKSVPGWNEIDAVALIDDKKRKQWASEARASSTYGQEKVIPFVDPFLTEEDRRRELKAEVISQLQEHKETIRQYRDAIAVEEKEIEKLYQRIEKLGGRTPK